MHGIRNFVEYASYCDKVAIHAAVVYVGLKRLYCDKTKVLINTQIGNLNDKFVKLFVLLEIVISRVSFILQSK